MFSFFQSSGQSNMSRELDISYSKNFAFNREAKRQDNLRYQNLIKSAACAMISDTETLKNTLKNAIETYLKTIENKFFRNDGRKRANKLKKEINEASTSSEIITALKSILNVGNEDKDSLKTFLLSNINLTFCQNKIPSFYTCTGILKNITTEANIQLGCTTIQNSM
ncbi:MAG: hypothetical protein NTZ67_04785 [Gammaproteobacteria bacterium]|nr:hypothetical protein [Gammaproteobacteria bacterium]